MTIAIEAWRRDRFQTEAIKVTEAVFTFVAVDDAGKPRPVIQE
jgi:acyl-CoA thioesterase YciA